MTFVVNENSFSQKPSVSKVLKPGEHNCKIVDIKLEAPSYDVNQYQLTIILEGEEETDPNFEGMAKDKINPDIKYLGKVAFVKATQYNFKDFTYNSKLSTKEDQIYKWMMKFINQMGKTKDIGSHSFETLEEFIDFSRGLLKDSWGYFTIAGKETIKEGYSSPLYSLFFPKFIYNGYDLVGTFVSTDKDRIIPFDEKIHIIKSNVASEASVKIEDPSIIPNPLPNSSGNAIDDLFAGISLKTDPKDIPEIF